MPLLLDIIAYFKFKGLVTGDGIDCFRDSLPDDPDNVVSLTEYPGSPGTPFMQEVHRNIQIVTRSINADSARTLALSLYKSLETNESRRIDFTDSRMGQVYLRQPPFKINYDDRQRTTYGFNIGITTANE